MSSPNARLNARLWVPCIAALLAVVAVAAVAQTTGNTAASDDAGAPILRPQPVTVQPVQPGMQATPPALGGHGAPAQGIPAPTVVLKPGEEPKIEFDNPNYNVGRIPAGQDILHDYWFTNTGTGPLEIVMFKPSCGCTTTGQYDRIIQPGESGRIPIKVTTGKMNGPISKTATVHTNIPGTMSTITLKVEGELWMPIACTPNAATFGTVTSDQAAGPPLERHVTIVNNMDAPTTIKDLKVSNTAFRVETKELEPGKKWDLLVTALTPLNPGNNYGQITFNTDLTEQPNVSLAATAYVAPDVDFTPTQVLVMPMANQTTPIVRQVTVRNNKMDMNLAITDLVCTHAEAKVTLKEQTPGKIFLLTLELPATVKPGTAQDKITFKTNNPKHAEVNIPLMIRPAPTPAVAGATPAKFSPTVTPMAPPADGTLPPQLSATASPVAAQPISATADEQTPAKDAAAAPKQPGANP